MPTFRRNVLVSFSWLGDSVINLWIQPETAGTRRVINNNETLLHWIDSSYHMKLMEINSIVIGGEKSDRRMDTTTPKCVHSMNVVWIFSSTSTRAFLWRRWHANKCYLLLSVNSPDRNWMTSDSNRAKDVWNLSQLWWAHTWSSRLQMMKLCLQPLWMLFRW